MKEINKSSNMPAWALILIIILFIIGLIVSIWGAASVFKLKNNLENNDIKKIFKNKEIIKYENGFKNESGIYALIFNNFNSKEYFWPILIFESTKFSQSALEIIDKIEQKKYKNIEDYMQENGLNKTDIRFIQLEENIDYEKLKYWIKKTKTDIRGFNK
ncbi:hypothetical protein [Spiroplasma cantharicola]|uniref:Uncharacterized protein n=1 Tax=Spiroplasma cantharicola TaxID=362837 RepID=A0A0M4KBS6_9MOLU|nr:hypothetical protein [Spiroplasma cantharicola]ALD66077.1 hypothetical protein SCANT_v1c01670 [Spiroplasma cantharicola]